MAINVQDQNMDDVVNWIDQINQDCDDIEARVRDEESAISHQWDGEVVDEGKVRSDEEAIEKDKNDLQHLKDEISSLNKDGQFSGLLDSLQSCIDGIASTNSSQGSANGNDIHMMSEDLQNISSYIRQIAQALKGQVQLSLDNQQYTQDLDNGADSSVLSKDMNKIFADSSAISQILEKLQLEMTNNLDSFDKESTQADNDRNSIHWWDPRDWTGWRKWTDDNLINNANKIEALISKIESAIAPMEASGMNANLALISEQLEALKHQLDEIMKSAENATPEQRSADVMKLNQSVVGLFILVAGLLGIVQEDAAKNKAKNEERMSNASIHASEIDLQKSQAEQKRIQESEAYASTMNKIMEVCKYVMMGAMMIMAPGIGTLLAGAAMVALEATGATKKATDWLAKQTGNQVLADVIVGVSEMVLTLGAGAVLDAIANKACEATMLAIDTSVKDVIKQAVENAVEEVANRTGRQVSNEVREIIESSVKKAVEEAAKKTLKMALQKGWMSAVGELSSGVACKEAVEIAVKEAAETSGSKLANLFSGLSENTDYTSSLMKGALENIETSTVDRSVGTAIQKTEEEIAQSEGRKLSSGWMKAWHYFNKGALQSGALYAMTSTNVIVDIAKECQKKFHAMSDASFDQLVQALQMIQQILQMLTQFAGAGAGAQAFNSTSTAMRTFMGTSQIANMGSGLVETGANVGLFDVYSDESKAVRAMGEFQALLSLLNQMMVPQINKRQQAESQSDNQAFAQQMQSVSQTASSCYAYLNGAAQVLQA